MKTKQSASEISAPDGDLRPTVRQHTQDIAELRQDVGEIKRSQNALRDEVIGMRAEGKQWRSGSDQKTESLQASITSLTREIAIRNGVDQERNRLAEESLRRLRKWAIIIGIFSSLGAAIGGTLLSDQEVASTIWVKWLHLREPWDMPTQPAPHPQVTQFILPPRDMEAV